MNRISQELVLFTILLLLFVSFGFAQVESKSSEVDKAMETLMVVDAYALGPIGYGGVTSKGQKALKVVLDSKSPGPLLRKLLAEGSPEGQIYALLGLKVIGKELFEREVARIRQDKAAVEKQVSYQRGCILSTISFEDAIKLLEKLNISEKRKDG